MFTKNKGESRFLSPRRGKLEEARASSSIRVQLLPKYVASRTEKLMSNIALPRPAEILLPSKSFTDIH